MLWINHANQYSVLLDMNIGKHNVEVDMHRVDRENMFEEDVVTPCIFAVVVALVRLLREL